jgi:hypothetical protein
MTIVMIASASYFFYCCKKSKNVVNLKEARDINARAIQATIQRYGRITAAVFYDIK